MAENLKYHPRLIEKIRGKDLSGFEQFYKDFFPSLCVFAAKYLQDEEISQDIVQDAFLYFWKKNIHFWSNTSAKSYLFKYVKNRSLNYIRDRHLENKEIIADKETDVYFRDMIIEAEAYQILYSAIVTLPKQGQRVIDLTLDGFKNREIAEQLGISVNTVKTIKRQAYQTLRGELKENVLILVSILQKKAKN